jgi:hypothetical protein
MPEEADEESTDEDQGVGGPRGDVAEGGDQHFQEIKTRVGCRCCGNVR